jgi:ArsR family transcriptional regulator
MHITPEDKMRELVKVYKVLSDESRLRVLALLNVRACCVCEVMQVLDISQSKASRILGSLYDAEILKLQKEGLWSLYSIDWEGMDKYLKDIIETTIDTIKTNKTVIAERERLKKAKRVGPDCVCKTETSKTAAAV